MKEGDTMDVLITKRIFKGSGWYGEQILEVLINGQKHSVEYLLQKLNERVKDA